MTLLLLCHSSPFSCAEFIFNIDFEDPPHVVGSAPATGGGPGAPTTSTSMTIATGVADYGTQVAVMDPATSLGGLGFFTGETYNDGIHAISWEWALAQAGGGLLEAAFFVTSYAGPGTLIQVSYRPNGSIGVTDQVSGNQDVGIWTLNESASYRIVLNFDADKYDFFIDGNQVLFGSPLDPIQNIAATSFQRPFGSPSFAIDNFQWQIIPEPGSIWLVVGGGWLVVRAWRRRKPVER